MFLKKHLKTTIVQQMDNNSKFWFDIDNKQVPNVERMTSYLLNNNILNIGECGCNNGNFAILFVDLNDVFGAGADCHVITCEEIPTLFDIYVKNGNDGIINYIANIRGIKNID
jgi:hypothetical protein